MGKSVAITSWLILVLLKMTTCTDEKRGKRCRKYHARLSIVRADKEAAEAQGGLLQWWAPASPSQTQ